MNIGEPRRIHRVEPLKSPVPRKLDPPPAPRQPARREPAKAPAK
jgi:hypothetical protein